MKRVLPFFCFVFLALISSGQCDDLFFSEYVEGYANNKALEIYNPTTSSIELSEYSIARFSNGSTSVGDNKIIALPSHVLEPNDVFVIVVDLTDTTQWNSQFDKPAWNGFNVIDTLYDAVTGDVLTDSLGNALIGPQYLDGSALFGDDYNEEYDLQCKADAFLCPDYDTNNTMYFNGNDAMALLKGSALEADGSNLIDVIGVIGDDPTVSIMQDAWVDEEGGWLTKDKTLVRSFSEETGRSAFSEVLSTQGGTFVGEGWFKSYKNDFSYLGIHNSVCNAEDTPDKFSCSLGPILSSTDLSPIAFNIYPNPSAKGTVQIEAESNISSIEVYNLLGERVFTDKSALNSNISSLNVGQLHSGSYLVKVYFSENHFSLKKLIIE